jgi:transcriptional regulator with PAS, ATPase and Fis domain
VFEQLAILPGEPLEPEGGALLGRSIAMQRLRAQIGRVAGRPVSVFVLGESGVGKELIAQELHRCSRRAGPFVPVNCGALPEALVESELFGHVAGAFTGADRARPGLFAAARRGTLFLDEIGEMPAAMQPKLLRALASGEVRPVGGTEPERLDVRIVAATNRVKLEEAVQQGTFRGDLYARLAGWTIVAPPLRARREDVLALARRFLDQAGSAAPLSSDAAEALLLHAWPYNVRELEQLMAQTAVRVDGAPTVELTHLPAALAAPLAARGAASPSPAAETPLEILVARDVTPGREQLEIVLGRLEGNMARVAEYFRKERRQVYRWVERHGLDPEAYRPREPGAGDR